MQPRPESHDAFVSTGRLPVPETVMASVSEAHQRFKSNTDGQNSNVYPALSEGCRATSSAMRRRNRAATSTAPGHRPPILYHERVEAVLVRLVCQAIGARGSARKLGANATGMPFNSLGAVERSPDGRTNPMVNAGAIATTSLVPGTSVEAKWRFIHNGLSNLRAGRFCSMKKCTHPLRRQTIAIGRLPACSSATTYLSRPRAGNRPLHQAMLTST